MNKLENVIDGIGDVRCYQCSFLEACAEYERLGYDHFCSVLIDKIKEDQEDEA